MRKKVTIDDLFKPVEFVTKELRPKMFVLSPNDIERVEVCPASRVLVGPKEKPGHSMWYGIFLHRFLEYVVTRGRREALKYIKSKKNSAQKVCERLDVSSIPEGAMAEFNVGTNLVTGEGEAVERDFADWVTHVLGRCDLAWIDDNGEWHVGDYKSGTEHKKVAKGNVQLLTLAVGLARMHELKRVWVHIISVDAKTGTLDFDGNKHLVKKKELDAHYERMRHAHLLTLETRAELTEEGVQPDFVAGDHCFGCRAREACKMVKAIPSGKKGKKP